MKRILAGLLLACLAFVPTHASAQAIVAPCVTTTGVPATSSGCNRVTPTNPLPVTTSVSGSGVTAVSSSALAANLVVNATAASLFSFNVQADSTLSGAAWWVMIYNATTAPGDGAVTPVKCYSLPTGATGISGAFPSPVAFSTGIVIGVSTTGCFNKTASTHAFISGDYK